MSAVPWSLAACIGEDPELFFAQSHNLAQDALDTAAALRVCRRCLIRASCLQNAMEREGGAGRAGRWGVAGGLKSGQRALLPRPTPKVVEHECGSDRAYRLHVRRGEAPDVACIEANRAYRRSRAAVA